MSTPPPSASDPTRNGPSPDGTRPGGNGRAPRVEPAPGPLPSATERPPDDPRSDGAYFTEVYLELRRMAEAHMAHQNAAHTLQPTALVHEVYLKLAGRAQGCDSTEHFLNLAARAMRQVLVDHARRRTAQRRRATGERVPLDSLLEAYEEHTGDLLELEEALEGLERVDPELVRLVELRFYAGRTTNEIAHLLGRSVRDVERRWQATRAVLRRELGR